MLIVGALWIVVADDRDYGLTTKTYGAINFDGLPDFLANSMFAFICHHSIPAILSPVMPESRIKHINILSFSSSFVFIILICYTGIMAFGDSIVGDDKDELRYYNYNFENGAKITYYFASFYMFLNIAALPVLIIVIRNNLMKWLVP